MQPYRKLLYDKHNWIQKSEIREQERKYEAVSRFIVMTSPWMQDVHTNSCLFQIWLDLQLEKPFSHFKETSSYTYLKALGIILYVDSLLLNTIIIANENESEK